MSTLAKRATVYLDPILHKALRLQSLETSRSVSDLINDAIRDELAEDAEDLAAFESRKNEPAVAFEDFVKELKRAGKILRLVIKKSVFKDVRNFPKSDVVRILAAIQSLADNPRPPQSKKLSGQERYRLRQGRYRILYSIEDDKRIACVVKIGDRKEVYR